MRNVIFSILTLCVCSCTTSVNDSWVDDEQSEQSYSDRVFSETFHELDDYTANEKITGPTYPEDHGENLRRNTFLAGLAGGRRSVIGRRLLKDRGPSSKLIAVRGSNDPKTPDTKEWRVLLVVSAVGIDWKFLRQAYARGGRKLQTHELGRRVYSGNSVAEFIAIELPKEYYAGEAMEEGIDVRIDGKWGVMHVNLPADYLQGFEKKKASLISEMRKSSEAK